MLGGMATCSAQSLVAAAPAQQRRARGEAAAGRAVSFSSRLRPLHASLGLMSRSQRSSRLRVVSADGEESLFEPERVVKAREKRQAKVKVTAPVVDRVNSGNVSAEGKAEAQYLSLLSLLFVVILLEGIAVGGSGLLPEAGDKFVLDYIFPAFTPTIGFFLLCSSAYGVWKAGLLGKKDQPKQ